MILDALDAFHIVDCQWLSCSANSNAGAIYLSGQAAMENYVIFFYCYFEGSSVNSGTGYDIVLSESDYWTTTSPFDMDTCRSHTEGTRVDPVSLPCGTLAPNVCDDYGWLPFGMCLDTYLPGGLKCSPSTIISQVCIQHETWFQKCGRDEDDVESCMDPTYPEPDENDCLFWGPDGYCWVDPVSVPRPVDSTNPYFHLQCSNSETYEGYRCNGYNSEGRASSPWSSQPLTEDYCESCEWGDADPTLESCYGPQIETVPVPIDGDLSFSSNSSMLLIDIISVFGTHSFTSCTWDLSNGEYGRAIFADFWRGESSDTSIVVDQCSFTKSDGPSDDVLAVC
jgi:hypothetical protein